MTLNNKKHPLLDLKLCLTMVFGPQRTISMMPVDWGVDFANNCLLNLRLFHSLLLLFVRAAGKETAIPTAQRDIHCYPSHKTQECMSFFAAKWWKIVPQNQKNMSHKTSHTISSKAPLSGDPTTLIAGETCTGLGPGNWWKSWHPPNTALSIWMRAFVFIIYIYIYISYPKWCQDMISI